jgi:hypothetical protein
MPTKPPKPTPDDDPIDPIWIRVPADKKLLQFLSSRGARADKGRSPWNRSHILRMQLDLWLASLDESDPRATRNFPQAYYDLTIKLLTEPWELNARMIKRLSAYVQTLLDLDDLLTEAGIDRGAYLAALEDLSFAERLHLVEAAQAHHAPKPHPGSPDL